MATAHVLKGLIKITIFYDILRFNMSNKCIDLPYLYDNVIMSPVMQ